MFGKIRFIIRIRATVGGFAYVLAFESQFFSPFVTIIEAHNTKAYLLTGARPAFVYAGTCFLVLNISS